MAERRFKSVEKDPEGGWIARHKDGREIFEVGFRWNSRSVARAVVVEASFVLEGGLTHGRQAPPSKGDQ